MKAFGDINKGPWQLVNVNPSSAAGKSVLSRPDGTVVSVNPDGGIESRPAGTDAAWEQCVIDGGIVTYCADGVRVYPFALKNA